MRESWAHVGRLWTNGEPFLAVDAIGRSEWRGYSNDDFERVIDLAAEATTISVGAGTAALIGGDGVVRDDSWIEVFQSEAGVLAFVQASGPDYPSVLAAALQYPDTEDDDGEHLLVGCGELAVFSTALDGTGEYSAPLSPARPGPVPLVHGAPRREPDPGLLLQTGNATTYRLKTRWYTELNSDSCFARWLLIPVRNNR
ncbi:hypothetical protein ACGFJ5_10235 [Micromonospora echinaurantiaca]|uniref:hypothetical protein n=1 Tax=Micromonospora echinaurantiaca TaxID=47857 RepID=UPI00371A7706